MAGSSCIIADGVSKRFGSVQVLEGLSLSITPGTVFGLVGLNGAGKTTLIRLLLGLLKADSGTVSILGEDPWGHNPALYRRLGVVLEHEGFWGNLTIKQNIRLFGEARGMTAQQRASYLAEAWSGTDLAASQRKVRFLSRGQKVQCGLCRAFMGWPEVLLLDEPTVALDVKAYDQFCDLVRRARSRGSAVLISSHQLSAIEELCDEVGILRNGRLVHLETGRGATSAQQWIIVTDVNCPAAGIITECGGAGPAGEGGRGTFTVSKPGEQIPEIVRRLAGAGYPVREVRPASGGLREAIRMMFD